MERMIPPSTSELLGGTISDELDRTEITVGKIGLISSAQALDLLSALDSIYAKINALAPGETKRALTTQLESLLAKLHKEAGHFIRNAGGTTSLREAREKVRPDKEHTWWYLDEFLIEKRKAVLRRITINGGIIIVVLVVLSLLYNRFLAPDPEVAARYGFEQSARDNIMYGNLEEASQDVEKGLAIAPQDSSLLILKGVILESQNQFEEAQKYYTTASKGVSKESFYLIRGQAYIMANLLEKAMADSQEAIKNNPDSVQGYLLIGQVNETIGQFKTALDDYNKAYEIADKLKQYELAALARTRMAMLMQSMNTQITPPAWMLTPTPTS
jgi:tetratricopeptide (TPR) repeat protein